MANVEPYTLPTVNFIGGTTQELECCVMTHDGSNEYDLTGCTPYFSLINYVNKMSTPQVYKQRDITTGVNGINNVLRVKLSASDTVDLTGKFVYQISIHGRSGSVDNRQGIMYIASNINRHCST